ncbi:copper resistance protein B [Pseudomonas sp. Hp2]|uniref:copper resistance protein B n=1 Tax=Pseudomonas sp. Hp2 TaxID=701189 RepID=UPI00112C6BD0|nr:copper resistance protein B [Pseudomonas sp. Hp2]
MKTRALATALLASLAIPAFAQQHDQHRHDHAAMRPQANAGDAGHPMPAPDAEHDPSQHGAIDHGAMNHDGMDHAAMDPLDHAAMGHTSATPREPIPAVTAADRAAAFPALHAHAGHAPGLNSYVLVDRLEGWNRDAGSGQAWEASAWIGGDIDRLWLRSEGERDSGRTHDSELEALYGHAISPWWDLLAGVRQQFRPEGSTWAALGVQGMAPYKFEVAATLYFGNGGDGLLKLEGEYDVLLTNRLILQPRLETTFALAGDAGRNGGDVLEAGVRLRYEIARRFAPYIGWEHERRFGGGADAAREHGESLRDSRFVAGVRIWF